MLLALRSLYESLAEAVATHFGTPATATDTSTGSGSSIRASKKPYFAFMQAATSFMSGYGVLTGDDWSLALSVSFYALPTQHASPTEEHVLFAYIDHNWASRGNLLRLGVSPDGSVFGGVIGGTTLRLAAGTIVPDGRPYDLYLDCTDGGTITLTCSGTTGAMAHDNMQMFPFATGFGQFMLFNGASGLTLCDCAISSATYNGETGTISWPITEGHGNTLAFSPNPNDDFAGMDFTLYADIYNPATNGFLDLPWGPLPNDSVGSVSSAFKWKNAPEWARVSKPDNFWTRRGA